MTKDNFWNRKRVFITGHTGFKGSWITQWLIMLGAEVKGYALSPETDPSIFKILSLDTEVESKIQDIRNAEVLSEEIIKFKPDIVFHLAAQPLVHYSYKNPRLTYETNVMGTLNLYEAIRACESVRVVVSITTDKCYENKEWVWGYRENDPMGGYDPYSSSKGCVELLSAAYRQSYFNIDTYGHSHQVSLATARAGNVIGGGDWGADRLIPDCIKFLRQKRAIVIRSPRATRPWQFVLEPLSGYLMLAQKMYEDGKNYCEGWNFGPSDSTIIDVETVVKNIINVWGEGEYIVENNKYFHEAKNLKLDSSKAKALLNWYTRYSSEKAITETIEWYKEYYAGSDIKKKSLSQINEYSSLR